MIFNIGFDPWWPYSSYPDDYYYNSGLPYYGQASPYYGYDYSYNDPGYYDSGDYQDQMYYDQSSYSGQSADYYDSTVYQSEVDYDQSGYQDYSNYRTTVAAQERLAREGYYQGESDGTFGPEMRQALKAYQRSHGLSMTGYLDSETIEAMRLR